MAPVTIDLVTFDFAVRRPASEPPPEISAIMTPARSGHVFKRREHPFSRYLMVRATIVFPNASGLTEKQFDEFWEARGGPTRAFLFKAIKPHHRIVEDVQIGVGDGIKTRFDLKDSAILVPKFLDAATVVGKVDGTPAALTLEDNNTDDIGLDFSAAPADTKPVTLSTEFYQPVFFELVLFPDDIRTAGKTLAKPGTSILTLTLAEVKPGYRYAKPAA